MKLYCFEDILFSRISRLGPKVELEQLTHLINELLRYFVQTCL